jgi:exodeoxyribonuclease-3
MRLAGRGQARRGAPAGDQVDRRGLPARGVRGAGYNVETHGQKGFNGVAILSKLPLEDVSRGLPGDDSDEQARWIEATVTGDRGAVRLCGLYLPNGNPAPGPKYDYKLAWMERMRAHAPGYWKRKMPAGAGGDYNVIPQDEDAAKPESWREDALALPESRAAFRRILNLGYTEAFRARTAARGIIPSGTTRPGPGTGTTASGSTTF